MREEKESDIQAAIIQFLRLKHFVVFKHHSTGFTAKNGQVRTFRYGDRGIADIIACAPDGRFWAIEVKRAGKKPTSEQTAFLNRVKANGGVGFVAYSVEDVNDELLRVHRSDARTLTAAAQWLQSKHQLPNL